MIHPNDLLLPGLRLGLATGRKDDPRNAGHPRNSSASVSAVVDRIENAPSDRVRGAKRRARRHNLTLPAPMTKMGQRGWDFDIVASSLTRILGDVQLSAVFFDMTAHAVVLSRKSSETRTSPIKLPQ
ncbi:hypothetical protein CFIMG_004144RA [Ceratocystis fimbriata CBS 114723]|uniref:Uncharacterized protein n=1 Tax=Ceratocystis fimbriata CBS 114723 TaxID=1035309 RepID=A0A2C5X0Y6_9PEZI|nr:hypothetical protein CFIMG_004144RA [Ceratocystis fimbriata CBS 114723]